MSLKKRFVGPDLNHSLFREGFKSQKGDPRLRIPFLDQRFFDQPVPSDSRLQYALDRRDAGHLPFVPHLVHRLLNVGELLFFEVVEAALFGAVMGRGLRLIYDLCPLTATSPLHILGSSDES